ncbi:MAG TPA: M43 family zinc metalloprotease [Chitinophagaceae bacterium]|nr:M43 family zinc metalloprotease [Chitinophagaceae bacterium]
MKRIPVLLFVLLYSCSLIAQKDCGLNLYRQALLGRYPALATYFHAFDSVKPKHLIPFRPGQNFDTLISAAPPKPIPASISIPVVVHIVWNNEADNITDAAVLTQLAILNQDFNGLNADRSKIPSYFSSLAADCGIRFVLAHSNEEGEPTTGIVRTRTSVASFGFDDRVKSSSTGGDDAWDASSYLNIWVCRLSAGVSGYASVPGGPAAIDGVVISSNAFGVHSGPGACNGGRTLVHETGHWLNLRHIWGDASCGDDLVEDTPPQQGANRGCNSGEKFSCGSSAHGDMYMNFMDFTDDACMYMFTIGQRQRMRSSFEPGGARNSILYSKALAGEGLLPLQNEENTNQLSVQLFPNPASSQLMLRVSGEAYQHSNVYICNQLGQVVKQLVLQSRQQQVDISQLQPGLYFIKMEGAASNGMKKFVKQ